MAVYPFLLIVSLPNQLLGHINITHISHQLTTLLESVTEDDSVSEDGDDDDDAEDEVVDDKMEGVESGNEEEGVKAPTEANIDTSLPPMSLESLLRFTATGSVLSGSTAPNR